jgi:hypothetical protein
MSLDFDLVMYVDTGGKEPVRFELFSANITHNLTDMAEAVNLYDVLWRPNENGFTWAHQIIDRLIFGIAELRSDPEKYSKYNASNGWGKYENFVPFCEKILAACQEHPKATIEVSR